MDGYYAVFLHAYAEGSCFTTIPLTLITFIIGLILATLTALARISGSRILQWIARIYVSIIRGTPLLVQLFIIFYGLPTLNIEVEPYTAAVVGFSLNVGAYASEIIRASDPFHSERAVGSSLHNWDDVPTSVKTCYFTASDARINPAAFEYIY